LSHFARLNPSYKTLVYVPDTLQIAVVFFIACGKVKKKKAKYIWKRYKESFVILTFARKT